MADWKKVQAQLEKLIEDASNVTGKIHTNITDGMQDLISGYGQGCSGEELPDAENAAFGLSTASEEYAITINDASKIASYAFYGTYSITVKYTVKEAFTLLGVRAYLVFNDYGTTIKVSINDEEKTAANIGYAQETKNDWTYRYFDTPINVSVGDVITLFQSSNQTKYPRYIPLSYATVNGKVELTYSYGGNGGNNPSMVHGIFDIIMAPVQAELPDSYEIQRTTMDDIAEEVQRISGATTKLNTAQIIDTLEDVKLQSKTVIPSEEQQIIAPDAGYFGLASVIVEKMKASGSAPMASVLITDTPANHIVTESNFDYLTDFKEEIE